MHVSFDSNAWERIFDLSDTSCAPIREKLKSGALKGFICATSFRIEAVRKRDRARYFAEPHMTVQAGISFLESQPRIHMSIGPDNRHHPGLPSIQSEKLQQALSTGIRLMYGCNWMGLPEPSEFQDRTVFVPETLDERHEREQRMLDVTASIDARGVGKAAFDAAGGWDALTIVETNDKQFSRACAEWADGELVAAHIAYQKDILCTDDFARSAGTSIFDKQNRAWLSDTYGVRFKTIDELLASP